MRWGIAKSREAGVPEDVLPNKTLVENLEDPLTGIPTGIVLVTGATGYVGGRLVPILERRGLKVRCMARNAERLIGRFQPETELVDADVMDPVRLRAALEGVETAFYLIHSMSRSDAFEERDRKAAEGFARAAADAGVRRIIYLGGLGDESNELSPHLRSRHEVGELLRSTEIEVIEFRASIVIGSGSLSFELVRALSERLPVMVTPRWVEVPAQPIFIGDLLHYLQASLNLPLGESRTFEIGGAEQVTYGDLLRRYAELRGLRRWIIPVPVLTPRLSSLWLGLVTPVYARVGRALIDSIQHPTIVRDPSARDAFDIEPIGAGEAIAMALCNEDQEFAETRWSDAASSSALESAAYGGTRLGNRHIDSRIVNVSADPETAFAPIQKIGGANGWYFGDWLWQLRGFVDMVLGGVGMRRGRRDPTRIRVGDSLDFWRVEASESGRLRLRAEMKVPGRAWLEFEVKPSAAGSEIRQTAEFDPLGIWGLAYWYGIFPLHQLVFSKMLAAIAQEAQGGKRPYSVAQQAAGLIGFLVAVFLAAAIGGWATASSVGSWYQELNKPPWTPPSWLFGPVWSALYTAMGVAAWLVWRARPRTERPMTLFWAHLALNSAWSVVFFGMKNPGGGLAVILALIGGIAATKAAFARVSRSAAWLLTPYLLWVAYATTLNAGIWWLN